MALSKDKKAEIVSEVSELFGNSKLTVIAKYTGTSVKAMQQLRRESKDNGTKVRIIKNRLVRKVLESNDTFKQLDTTLLTGQLLYAFNAEDEVAPAQSLANFAKTQPQIEFVGAVMANGQFLAAEEVKTLASLPGKNQLVAQVVAMLLSPVGDVLSGLSGDLANLLDGIAAKAS